MKLVGGRRLGPRVGEATSAALRAGLAMNDSFAGFGWSCGRPDRSGVCRPQDIHDSLLLRRAIAAASHEDE